MGGLLNLDSMPPDGIVNNRIARLSNLGLISGDITCYKDIYSFDKFDACLYLFNVLIIIR